MTTEISIHSPSVNAVGSSLRFAGNVVQAAVDGRHGGLQLRVVGGRWFFVVGDGFFAEGEQRGRHVDQIGSIGGELSQISR